MSEPFRKNFFGENIPQPACTGADFFNMTADTFDTTEIALVSLLDDDDPIYRFGCEVVMVGDHIINVDGFESLEACSKWVEDELGFYDYEIAS